MFHSDAYISCIPICVRDSIVLVLIALCLCLAVPVFKSGETAPDRGSSGGEWRYHRACCRGCQLQHWLTCGGWSPSFPLTALFIWWEQPLHWWGWPEIPHEPAAFPLPQVSLCLPQSPLPPPPPPPPVFLWQHFLEKQQCLLHLYYYCFFLSVAHNIFFSWHFASGLAVCWFS